MSLVFKTLLPETKNITNHTAHKNWVIQNEETGSYGIVFYEGKYITGSFNTIDTSLGDTPIEETTSNGQYKHLIHRSINNLYYQSPKDVDYPYDNPPKTFCSRVGQYKELNRDITVMSIPSGIFGNSIQPNTFSITSGSTVIKDDGNGNLYDSTSPSTYQSIDDLSLYIGFNEGYLYNNDNQVNVTPVDYVSKYKVVPSAYRIQFKDDSLSSELSRSYAFFGGTGSYGPGTIEDPTDNQFIEIENSKDFIFDRDFAVSFMIRIPIFQPTEESYEGGYEIDTDPPGEAIAAGSPSATRRTLVPHEENIIVTKREFDNEHIPFEIAISGSTNRDIIFRRKSRTNGEMFESAALKLSSATWYSVLFQKSGSNLTIGLQSTGGVYSSTVADPADGVSVTTPTNVHIGGRPYGYKNNYYDPGLAKHVEYKKNRNIIRPGQFEMSQFRLWDSAIDSTATSSLYVSESATNIVGNVFYEHGIATITPPINSIPSGHYHSIKDSEFELSFKGSHDISEHIYLCQVLDSEFSITQNPTTLDPASSSFGIISSSFVDSEEFSPYITTVGLYNDSNELLAIGKLAQAVKKPIDYDITFMIRFDT